MLRTHRLAWEFANGRPVPQGLQVLHDCDNPPCCNPSHLFLGTNADNNADMMSKGRNRVSRGSRNRTAANKVADVIRLRASGVASEAIADRLLIHRSTVDRILQNQK
ncbi:MAG: HNH endonuclease [Planctomycetes bacterium]|nr:HNH endonuclease [Planctomycetota bacterium]